MTLFGNTVMQNIKFKWRVEEGFSEKFCPWLVLVGQGRGGVGEGRVKITLLEHGHVAYQIKYHVE